jgi:ribosomal protein S18 acetylase RimI-like enzyme
MPLAKQEIIFKQLEENEPIPYALLLLADPAKDIIDAYLEESTIYIAEANKKTIGVIVLFPLNAQDVEIKNIAVESTWQGQGIGQFLIEKAMDLAIRQGFKCMFIGTANSSIGQLYLYQKLGFKFHEIKKDFFVNQYPEAIYENGLQAKDMIVLTRIL